MLVEPVELIEYPAMGIPTVADSPEDERAKLGVCRSKERTGATLKVLSKPGVANAGVTERFAITGVPNATSARTRTFKDLSFVCFSGEKIAPTAHVVSHVKIFTAREGNKKV